MIEVNDWCTGNSNVLKLDFDSHKIVPELWTRLPFIIAKLELDIICASYSYSPSGRGMHVVIYLNEMLTPNQIVFLQSLLGSDWRRETFNYIRAQAVGDAPAFWRTRWNVLYADKVRAGK
ncbi:MAG: hypothetical protein ACR2H1_11405 [Limisphaerales bacterium]